MENTIHNLDGSKTAFHDDGSDLIIEHKADISAVLNANKAEYAQNDERKRWSDDAFGNKVASIPLVVFQELEKQGITKGFTVLDMPRFKAWLNNPDNRAFRTRTGRI